MCTEVGGYGDGGDGGAAAAAAAAAAEAQAAAEAAAREAARIAAEKAAAEAAAAAAAKAAAEAAAAAAAKAAAEAAAAEAAKQAEEAARAEAAAAEAKQAENPEAAKLAEEEAAREAQEAKAAEEEAAKAAETALKEQQEADAAQKEAAEAAKELEDLKLQQDQERQQEQDQQEGTLANADIEENLASVGGGILTMGQQASPVHPREAEALQVQIEAKASEQAKPEEGNWFMNQLQAKAQEAAQFVQDKAQDLATAAKQAKTDLTAAVEQKTQEAAAALQEHAPEVMNTLEAANAKIEETKAQAAQVIDTVQTATAQTIADAKQLGSDLSLATQQTVKDAGNVAKDYGAMLGELGKGETWVDGAKGISISVGEARNDVAGNETSERAEAQLRVAAEDAERAKQAASGAKPGIADAPPPAEPKDRQAALQVLNNEIAATRQQLDEARLFGVGEDANIITLTGHAWSRHGAGAQERRINEFMLEERLTRLENKAGEYARAETTYAEAKGEMKLAASQSRAVGDADRDTKVATYETGAAASEVVRSGMVSAGTAVAGPQGGALVSALTQSAMEASYAANGMERSNSDRLWSVGGDVVNIVALKGGQSMTQASLAKATTSTSGEVVEATVRQQVAAATKGGLVSNSINSSFSLTKQSTEILSNDQLTSDDKVAALASAGRGEAANFMFGMASSSFSARIPQNQILNQSLSDATINYGQAHASALASRGEFATGQEILNSTLSTIQGVSQNYMTHPGNVKPAGSDTTPKASGDPEASTQNTLPADNPADTIPASDNSNQPEVSQPQTDLSASDTEPSQPLVTAQGEEPAADTSDAPAATPPYDTGDKGDDGVPSAPLAQSEEAPETTIPSVIPAPTETKTAEPAAEVQNEDGVNSDQQGTPSDPPAQSEDPSTNVTTMPGEPDQIDPTLTEAPQLQAEQPVPSENETAELSLPSQSEEPAADTGDTPPNPPSDTGDGGGDDDKSSLAIVPYRRPAAETDSETQAHASYGPHPDMPVEPDNSIQPQSLPRSVLEPIVSESLPDLIPADRFASMSPVERRVATENLARDLEANTDGTRPGITDRLNQLASDPDAAASAIGPLPTWLRASSDPRPLGVTDTTETDGVMYSPDTNKSYRLADPDSPGPKLVPVETNASAFYDPDRNATFQRDPDSGQMSMVGRGNNLPDRPETPEPPRPFMGTAPLDVIKYSILYPFQAREDQRPDGTSLRLGRFDKGFYDVQGAVAILKDTLNRAVTDHPTRSYPMDSAERPLPPPPDPQFMPENRVKAKLSSDAGKVEVAINDVINRIPYLRDQVGMVTEAGIRQSLTAINGQTREYNPFGDLNQEQKRAYLKESFDADEIASMPRRQVNELYARQAGADLREQLTTQFGKHALSSMSKGDQAQALAEVRKEILRTMPEADIEKLGGDVFIKDKLTDDLGERSIANLSEADLRRVMKDQSFRVDRSVLAQLVQVAPLEKAMDWGMSYVLPISFTGGQAYAEVSLKNNLEGSGTGFAVKDDRFASGFGPNFMYDPSKSDKPYVFGADAKIKFTTQMEPEIGPPGFVMQALMGGLPFETLGFAPSPKLALRWIGYIGNDEKGRAGYLTVPAGTRASEDVVTKWERAFDGGNTWFHQAGSPLDADRQLLRTYETKGPFEVWGAVIKGWVTGDQTKSEWWRDTTLGEMLPAKRGNELDVTQNRFDPGAVFGFGWASPSFNIPGLKLPFELPFVGGTAVPYAASLNIINTEQGGVFKFIRPNKTGDGKPSTFVPPEPPNATHALEDITPNVPLAAQPVLDEILRTENHRWTPESIEAVQTYFNELDQHPNHRIRSEASLAWQVLTQMPGQRFRSDWPITEDQVAGLRRIIERHAAVEPPQLALPAAQEQGADAAPVPRPDTDVALLAQEASNALRYSPNWTPEAVAAVNRYLDDAVQSDNHRIAAMARDVRRTIGLDSPPENSPLTREQVDVLTRLMRADAKRRGAFGGGAPERDEDATS